MTKSTATSGTAYCIGAAFCVWVVLLVCIFAFSPNFGAFSEHRGSPYAGDFLQEWIGGHVVLNHGAASLYDDGLVKELQHDKQLVGFGFDATSYFLMVYPPAYYILVSPLSLLPFKTAAWLFVSLMVVCLGWAGYLLFRCLPDLSAVRFSCLFASTLIFAPLIESLASGQKGTLCLLLLSGAFYLLKRERPFTAGMVFGLLAFKPQLAIVIGLAMLLKGQRRFTYGALASAATVAVFCLPAGWAGCAQFIAQCAGAADYVTTGGYDLHKSHCVYGFLVLLSGGQTDWIVKAAAIGVAAIILVLLRNILRGNLEPTSKAFNRQFAALVVATLLLSPHLFTYDLTLLLLPMVLLYDEAKDKSFMSPALGIVGVLFVVSGFSYQLALQSGLQLTTIAMVALLWSVARNDRSLSQSESSLLDEAHPA